MRHTMQNKCGVFRDAKLLAEGITSHLLSPKGYADVDVKRHPHSASYDFKSHVVGGEPIAINRVQIQTS